MENFEEFSFQNVLQFSKNDIVILYILHCYIAIEKNSNLLFTF